MDPGTPAGVTKEILARVVLKCPRQIEAGITRVSGKPSGKLVRNAALLAALACVVLAISGKPQAALEIAIRADSGHALLRLGFASVSVAFDSGQECPNSNACAGSIL